MVKLGIYSWDEDELATDPAERTYTQLGLFDFEEQEWVGTPGPAVEVQVDPPISQEEFVKKFSTASIDVTRPENVPGEVRVPDFEDE